MGSRGYFRLIAILLLLVVAAAIAFALFAGEGSPQPWMYGVAQLIVIAVAVLLIVLYRKTIKPLNTLTGGIDLIKEQDFSTRLRPVRQRDADRIIELFNRMSDRLHNEELRIQEQNHFLDQLIAASPAGVLIMDIDHHVDSANPAMNRMLGIDSIGPYRGQLLQDTPLPLLRLLGTLQPDEGRILQTDPLHIYRCTHSSFMDRGFPHPFFMVEPMTEELYEAEKRGYKKVIRVISHEVNNTMAGITSALYAIQQTSTDSGGRGYCRHALDTAVQNRPDEPLHYRLRLDGQDSGPCVQTGGCLRLPAPCDALPGEPQGAETDSVRHRYR